MRGEMLIKGYKFHLDRRISSRDLLYHVVTIVNNNVLCLFGGILGFQLMAS
jgi:hypothetical protein